MQFKAIISIIAVALTFIGYAPYVRDVINKKTTPHVFTWFIWTFAGFIAYGLQVLGGAGVGSWTLLAAALICAAIFLFTLRTGDKDIVASDIVFFVLALVALFLWLVVKQPVWSTILITVTEILGFIPTVRKSWNKPYSETLVSYAIAGVRHGFSLFSLQKINILTVFYPIAWVFANLFFCIFLFVRRKQLSGGGAALK